MYHFDKESLKQGYFIVKAQKLNPLKKVREILFEEAVRLTKSTKEVSAEEYFNKFHELGLRDSDLNDFRISLFKNFNNRIDVGKLIWEAFKDPLEALIGPDVAVQKLANLVIHQPNDLSITPVHRDAPPNSPYEIVVWLPLVNCFDTKSMYILDRESNQSILNKLGTDGKFEDMVSSAMNKGKPCDITFGHAILFWSGLMHAVPVNKENETRWSLNLRYKNIFSPYGSKGLPDFFRILYLSPITKWGIESERQQIKLDSSETEEISS
jgi:sporadic carbohydrate cluster 2OG-Fe(II) oxygenase